MRRAVYLIIVIGWVILTVLAAPVPATTAQESTGSANCAALYTAAITDMMQNCFGKEPGTACGAAGDVSIEMMSGQTVEGAGITAKISGVFALRARPGDGSAWSLASLTLPDMIDSEKSAALIVLGPADLEFQPASSLTPGAVFSLTNGAAPLCSDLPRPGLLVQSAENSLTLLNINGVDLAINGMALIQAHDDGSLTVNALARETILGQTGTVVFAGYSVQASEVGVSDVVPYDQAAVANLPTAILPVIDVISLPGNAIVTEEMNLFFRPDPAAYSNTIIQAGLPVTVLGRNTAGDWLNVRTYEGETGWMPANVLDVHVPVEMPVYDTAPAPPHRPFGSIYGYIKTSAEYNNLRSGPGEQYDIVATVPLWTDLALYGRSPDDQWLLIETLDTHQRAWISVTLVSPTTPYRLQDLPYPPEFGG
jgi:uncharacterized protein YgiM (DUF1202 family)